MTLLDTSGLLCFVDQDEARHVAAVHHFTASARHLTHGLVLAELVALAHARGLPRASVLAFLDRLEGNAAIEVVFVDHRLHRAAVDLLLRRADKDWSLCDAVSFVLMGERGITEALTTDHHFEQAGFVKLLPS